MNAITSVDVKPILVDARNFDILVGEILTKVRAAKLVGLDLETHDAGRHEGLNQFMRADAEGRKAGNRPLVFDVNRTVICGFSIYCDGDTVAYYVNLAHADYENTVRWEKAKQILDAIPEDACFVAHNSMFERTMLRKSLGYRLPTTICTMQLAVSAHGPDEYEPMDFHRLGIEPIRSIISEAAKTFANFTDRNNMTGAQGELFAKFLAKESVAAHSYNGWVETISRPYGLKQAVEYWFGVKMQTFEETLDGEVHMGKLTGEQVVSYGADDSVWAVRLYHKLIAYMQRTNPAAIRAYFTQELPCIDYYSDVWAEGLRINGTAVAAKREEERHGYAETLRKMKASIRALLPFPVEPHEGLTKFDGQPADGKKRAGWYVNGCAKYRTNLTKWANTPDCEDDFDESQLVKGPISTAWALDKGLSEPNTLSITYWSTARTLMYDLLREKVIVEKGKVQSDGEARGKMTDRLDAKLKQLKSEDDHVMGITPETERSKERLQHGLDLLGGMSKLSQTEQVAKLYLNPYTQLIDPDTSRVYPIISSKLASRRTSISNPNGQQLAKRGESKYVRGFYLADYDDHVILSEDWSGIELVLIGEFSGDPEFRKAFGQLPYQDLHLGATASCLGVVWGDELTRNIEKQWTTFERYGVTSEELNNPSSLMEWFLKKLKSMTEADVALGHPKLLVNLKGELMKPADALKYWRTEVGKAANFGYWYSGALSDVGTRLGWSSDQMWKAVEGYRNHFAVAEQWRLNTISFAQANGYVQLPDGHRRVRWECTEEWAQAFVSKFQGWEGVEGVNNFLRTARKAIQARANNQVVNSMIQGSCATMMKRSILRLREAIKAAGYTDREMRVLIPIHDELLMSVHKDLVVEAIELCRTAMCTPDIVTSLPLTVAPAIGRTFEPFSKGKRTGQIELGELSAVPCVPEARWGQEATHDEVRAVVDYIFEKEAA